MLKTLNARQHQCFQWNVSCQYYNTNSSDYAKKPPSLLFINNSAKFGGSTLYGGQLNKCRLYYITNFTRDECGNWPRACHDYTDDTLGIFMHMSNIDETTSISSQAEKVKFCEGENVIADGNTLDTRVIPGEEFNVTVIALDQSGFPVPATIFSENQYTGTESDHEVEYYRHLIPPSQSISDGSCTNITFKLYYSESVLKETYKYFKLYADNVC